jgi:hypothetical protein
MTIDKLKRVCWRLKEIQPNGLYSYKMIRQAIMEECGTDERTIKATLDKMVELKLLERAGFGRMRDTHKG